MSHEAWAWRVLTGDSLADKLATPESGGPVPLGAPPAAPGRPPGLGLPVRGAASVRTSFPGEQALEDPEARGRVLHFFANHELLALELMALAIVRFRDAPEPFRRGLVGIMVDEQRHLAGYVARMAAWGVRFGDLPVNRYLWDALSGADALQMVAGLALTFEQANLDFSAQYAAAFRRVGDIETAEALEEVLADEVRHVRHGLIWFDKWRPRGPTLWEAWVAALPHPLTPARARGPRFFRAPREEAGFDADTIARVEVFGASRGRPPRVHSFHPEVEAEVAGLPPTTTGARVARDLAGTCIFLATRDDVVLVPRAPTPAFLAELAQAGFALPEVVEGGPERLVGRTLGELRPWGWSPAVSAVLAPLGAAPWNPRLRKLHEKTWATKRLMERPDLCDPAVVGVACHLWDDVVRVTTSAHVWKAPLGTAGRGLRRPDTPGAEEWGRRVLEEQGALVVEPWLDRVIDLSLQFDVAADGGVRAGAWGRFLTDGRGRYRGAVVGLSLDDQPAPVRRLLSEQGARLSAMADHLGRAMALEGFTGPAGLDALVYRTPDGGLALKPLVELNARNTMGRVARALERRVRAGRVGLWVQVSKKDARTAGYRGISDWAEALRARAPLVIESAPPRVESGALFTTDPAVADRLVTVLVVARRLAECRERLGVPGAHE